MAENKMDVAPETGSTSIQANFGYLRTIPALLKIFEFLLCLFAFAFAASFVDEMDKFPSTSWGIAHFFIFVMVTSWLGCIVLFLVYFLNVASKLKKFPYAFLLLAAMHYVGALFMLIATALLMDDALDIRGRKYRIFGRTVSFCDIISNTTSTSCPVYEVGAAAGFFAFLAVAIDGVLHTFKGVNEFRIYQANRQEENPSAPDDM